jgi:low affinity Fe/Cu permease
MSAGADRRRRALSRRAGAFIDPACPATPAGVAPHGGNAMSNNCTPGAEKPPHETFMATLAHYATEWTGSSGAFFLAALIVVVWLVSGPLFHYSDTWQLVINTGTTIVTFLMVFLLQRSQNRESRATQLKLNELIAAVRGASNRLINVEGLTEKELNGLYDHYKTLAEIAKKERDMRRSHSVEQTFKKSSVPNQAAPDASLRPGAAPQA